MGGNDLIHTLAERLGNASEGTVSAAVRPWQLMWKPAEGERDVVIETEPGKLAARLEALTDKGSVSPWGADVSAEETAWRLLVTHLEEEYWAMPAGHGRLIIGADGVHTAS
ncbi:hypothetical protein GCM10027079_29720 [Sediminivirga luteola]|jgi:hypothetical protein|uniref:Uncharacterized protein n=1 Tax=Sediminivirga luteola TaxID=1774748 RepID=A0A8J2U064_9MICO|nr:hypothetical protein GCM10011333_27770 [Sediminivirga luteola]